MRDEACRDLKVGLARANQRRRSISKGSYGGGRRREKPKDMAFFVWLNAELPVS